MRKHFLIAAVITSCAVGITACSRGDENKPADNTTTRTQTTAMTTEPINKPTQQEPIQTADTTGATTTTTVTPAAPAAPTGPQEVVQQQTTTTTTSTGVNEQGHPTETTKSTTTTSAPAETTTPPSMNPAPGSNRPATAAPAQPNPEDVTINPPTPDNTGAPATTQ